jgi:malonyl CoA-acyl carrier protein transacylase
MGESLFDRVSEFTSVEAHVDALLGYSLRRLCLTDADNRLKETQYTQPALFVVNALHYYDALHRGPPPDYLAGHSLGEYNALLAAGVFDLLTGLRLVRKRGELMSRARNGAMTAVIGLPSATITRVCLENGLADVDIANYNSPSQTVLSGPKETIERAGILFERAGASLCAPLAVSAAFHSRYMTEAGEQFGAFLAPFIFAAPRIPVVANVTGEPYPLADPSPAVKALLVRQIAQPVRWTQSVRYLLGRGVSRFQELGPGNVLTRLIEQTRKAA